MVLAVRDWGRGSQASCCSTSSSIDQNLTLPTVKAPTDDQGVEKRSDRRKKTLPPQKLRQDLQAVRTSLRNPWLMCFVVVTLEGGLAHCGHIGSTDIVEAWPLSVSRAASLPPTGVGALLPLCGPATSTLLPASVNSAPLDPS